MDFLLSFFQAIKAPALVIVSLWVVSRKLWLYLLKDVIVKKLNEIQDAKKAIRKVSSNALIYVCEYDSDNPFVEIDKELLDISQEVFSEIVEKGYHTERGLATVTMVADRFFSKFNPEINKHLKKGEAGKLTFPHSTYSFIMFRALDYIESLAARSVEMPKAVSVKMKDSMPVGKRFFFSGGGVKYIKGIDQGPVISQCDYFCVEFFFRIVGVSADSSNCLKNKFYFQVVGGNSLFYSVFWQEKYFSPLEVSFGETPFGEKRLSLVACRSVTRYGPESTEEILELCYANLSDRMRFVESLNPKAIAESFDLASGYSHEKIAMLSDCECVIISVKKGDAVKEYKKRKGEVVMKICESTQKNWFLFYVKLFFSALYDAVVTFAKRILLRK